MAQELHLGARLLVSLHNTICLASGKATTTCVTTPHRIPQVAQRRIVTSNAFAVVRHQMTMYHLFAQLLLPIVNRDYCGKALRTDAYLLLPQHLQYHRRSRLAGLQPQSSLLLLRPHQPLHQLRQQARQARHQRHPARRPARQRTETIQC